jgi:hypothetical protein
VNGTRRIETASDVYPVLDRPLPGRTSFPGQHRVFLIGQSHGRFLFTSGVRLASKGPVFKASGAIARRRAKRDRAGGIASSLGALE